MKKLSAGNKIQQKETQTGRDSGVWFVHPGAEAFLFQESNYYELNYFILWS